MAATFEYNEDNGAATGSPAKGTTRNTPVYFTNQITKTDTNANWAFVLLHQS